MEDPAELKDYVADLLQNAGSKVVAKFIRDFLQRRSGIVAGLQVGYDARDARALVSDDWGAQEKEGGEEM
jgi:hypothetical protein